MKSQIKKRVASSVLAGAMALSMAAPAFAANETAITATYQDIKLAVTVPTTGKATINPYGLPFKLGESTISGEQITTGAALTILNKSAVALKVGAKVTTTASSGVTLETSAPSGYDTETGKKMYVKFEAFPADDLVGDAAADTALVNSKFAALDSDNAALSAVLDTSAAATAAKPSTSKNELILREANADGELQKGGAAFFRLSGQVAQGATWTATDTFTATVAFTFTPTTFGRYFGTLACAGQNIQVGAASGGDKTTATMTLDLPAGVKPKRVIKWEASKKDVVTITDTSTPTATTPVISADVTAKAASSSEVKITVYVEGTDGLTYTATTASGKGVTVAAATP